MESLKFIILLALISAAIITVDQFIKRGRYWKYWLSGTTLAVLIYLLFIVNGPIEVKLFQLGNSDVTTKSESGQNGGPQETQKNGASGGQNGSNQQSDDSQLGGKAQEGRNSPNKSGPDSQLYPIDDAGQNQVFIKFRDEFIAAVRKKDLAFLKEHTSANIKYSFGTNNGLAGFLEQWKLTVNPDNSTVWSELDKVLALGGTFNKSRTVFTAPYVFSKFPKTVDAFENVAVIEQNVNIYPAPDSSSKPMMGLSYAILRLADQTVYEGLGTNPEKWRKIITPNGDKGYINEIHIRSPIDYRVQFASEKGGWKMIFLCQEIRK